MPRIVVVTSSPLLADGLTAALRGHAGWDVRPGRVDEEADAWVLAGDELVVRGVQGAGGGGGGVWRAPEPGAAHAARARGVRAAGQGPVEPRDRRRARHLGAHGE